MSENSKELERFKKELELLLGDFDESARRVVSNQANVGMAVTIRETPTDTGYLKRAWRKSKTVKVGNAHVSGYINIVEYAPYVNNGHRTVNADGETTGWVEGYFMAEKGINEAERQTPALFDAEIERIKRESGF